MHALGHQLFAGTAFAKNEDGILVQSNFLNDLVNTLHPLRQADQATEARARPQLLPEYLVFLLQLDGACGSFQPRTQFLNAKRLRYIVDRP